MIEDSDERPVDLPGDLDHERMAEAALAILSLTADDWGNVWKGLDWNLMNLLFNRGWISDPHNKNKSVQLSSSGREAATQFLYELFGRT